MFFTVTKMMQLIRMAWTICVCEKINDMSNQKLQWCQVSCVPIPLFKNLLVHRQLLRRHYMHALSMKYSI